MKKTARCFFFGALVLALPLGAMLIRPGRPVISLNQPAGDSAAPTPSPIKAVEVKPAPASAVLPSSVWVPQTYNNCGPASAAMILQHFGYEVSQADLKQKLRTNPDDRNVFTYEIAALLKKDYGIDSRLFYNGDLERLKLLIANGFYVIVEDLLRPDENIGHTIIIRGYDDAKGVLIADDSYFGAGREMPYAIFDERQWKVFNREYLPVFLPARAAVVESIVGNDWDETLMFERSAAFNDNLTRSDPSDMYAWFNLGSSYYHLGQYAKAQAAFEKSEALGWPERLLWYQYEPIKNYNALGEWAKALALIKLGLKNNNSYAELHYEAAVAYRGLGEAALARQEKALALEMAPDYQPAKDLVLAP